MNGRHLSSHDLDRVLTDPEMLEPELGAHLESCVVCRRRRDEFLRTVEVARGPEPDEEAMARARDGALADWQGGARRPRAGRRARFLAAAAALLVAVAALVLLRGDVAEQPEVNAEAVLQQVDEMLARDPLSAFVSEDVVDVVIPDVDEERSVS